MTQATEIMNAGFDLSQLDSTEAPTLFKLVLASDIDGNDKFGFMIDSKNCAEYREATRLVRIDGLKRSAKRKSALDTSTDEGAGAVAKMIDANEMTLALSVVKGWFGFQDKGVDVPFNKGLVEKMLTKFPTWKDKITSALDNESNFTKG